MSTFDEWLDSFEKPKELPATFDAWLDDFAENPAEKMTGPIFEPSRVAPSAATQVAPTALRAVGTAVEAGFQETTPMLAKQLATGDHYERPDLNMPQEILAEISSFVLDPVTYLSFGVGAKVGRAVGKKLVKRQVAKKYAERAATSAVGLAGMTAIRDPLHQELETSEYDLGRHAIETAKSGVLGAGLGAAGAIPKVGLPAEIGVIGAGGAALEGRLPTVDDWIHATGLVLGLKATGAVTRGGRALMKLARGKTPTTFEAEAIKDITPGERAEILKIASQKPPLLTPEGARQFATEHPGPAEKIRRKPSPSRSDVRGTPAEVLTSKTDRAELARLLKENQDATTLHEDARQLQEGRDVGKGREEEVRPYPQRRPEAGREARHEEVPEEAVVRSVAEEGVPSGAGFARAAEPGVHADLPVKDGPATGVVGRRMIVKPVPMPELVQLAKELMGHAPRIKKLRKSLGVFRSKEGSIDTEILIDPSVARSEQQLAEVLAHEIGHLTDFRPTNTLARGNILGRLRTLRKFLKGAFGDEGPTNNEIRQELITLTEWWTPYDKAKASPRYRKYRESSRELYAEALSVFLNSPGHLKERAPKFYNEFMEHLDRKPQVLDAYLKLQDVLSGTPDDIAKVRRRNLHEDFATGEEKIKASIEKKRAAQKSVIASTTELLGQYVLDSSSPIKRRVAQVEKMGAQFDEAKNARYILDELFNIDNPNHTMLERTQREMYGPLQELGVTRDDIGEYLFLRRVVNERNEIANPLGFTPTEAAKQMESIRGRLGPEKFTVLEKAMQRWHEDVIFPIAERAVEAGVYGREAFEKTIAPNKGNYATFAVIRHLEDHIPAGLYKQVGTFSGIANPLDATLMKMVTLNRLIAINEAKGVTRDLLTEYFADEITPVTIPHGAREPAKPAPPGMRHMTVLEDGKPHAYAVAREIADAFKGHDVGGLVRYANLLQSGVYKAFHPLYVTFNPGFQAANPFRDLRRTHLLLGSHGRKLNTELRAELESRGYTKAEARKAASKQKISLGQVMWAYWKAIPASYRRARGIDDATIRQMMDEKALTIPFVDIAAESAETMQYDRLLARHGLKDISKARSRMREWLGKFLGVIEGVGVLQETTSKVAGWNLLAARGITGKERAYQVRKIVGTPDYKQKGLATPVTNSIWMYSKVRWNGLQHEARIATEPQTRSGYWWRRAVWTVMPTTFTKAAMYGAFGPMVAGIMAMVPKYFLDNYDVIPLGTTNDDGEEKAVFLSIPRDDLGRFMGSAYSLMFDAAMEAAGQDTRRGSASDAMQSLLGEVWGEVMPNANPILDLAGKWGQYAMGRNPVDSFFNQPVVPRTEWDAGGWASARKMLSWSVDKFGVISTLAHPLTSPLLGGAFEVGEETSLEAKVKSFPGISRLLRVSNRGVDEQAWTDLASQDQERAKFRMNLPQSARRLTSRRYFLNRRGKLGLSDAEENERRLLNRWYTRVYLRFTRAIRDAPDEQTADILRRELGEKSQVVASPRSPQPLVGQ